MPRVTDEYYEKKRREIIDAAYRVCVRKPITSVDMKDIIAEAGFSHGVIYKYYKELDEIIRDLVITINERNKIDDRLDSILNNSELSDWKNTVIAVFKMLADYISKAGVDILKLSIYSDLLAMSDPERALKIEERLGKEDQSPLVYLITALAKYLKKVIKANDLKPSRSVDEMMQFVIVTYQGIQSGFVLAECFKTPQLSNKYKPKKMFSCLAESVICMMEGKNE
ncbi:MAG: TetR/AcrR family transcriptional regulator [Treponemataceae bacterium]|nr:TetR/AcrR family transcriptional regulator [Treponemataceae bacterium]